MLEILKDGLKTAFSKKLTWAALVLIPTIVGLFGLLYVNTFMDPIENMKNMPVAVINLDEGAKVDGKEQNYGDKLVDSILDNDSVDWREESPSLLDDGLENSSYYLAVIVPKNFSKKVAAGKTSEPEQADITYFKDVRKSYILSTFSSRIETALSTVVNEKIGEQYTRALAKGLVKAGDGYDKAASGADKLGRGSQHVESALNKAENGAFKLASGASELSSGTAKVESGAKTLASGARSATSGLQKLDSKGSDLEDGWSSLYSGITTATSATSTLAKRLSAGEKKIGAALSKAQTGASKLESAQEAYRQALAAYTRTVATTTNSATISAAAEKLNTAVTALGKASASSGAAEALEQAQTALSRTSTKTAKLGAAAEKLQKGADSFDTGLSAYTKGVGTAASGVKKLSGGADSLESALSSITDGAQSLQTGAGSLESGLGKIGSGTSKLTTGSAKLASSLDDGASTIDSSLTTTPKKYASYISEPVELQEDAYGDLEKFGYGFAPFFMTLCFWLGTLLIFFIFDPYPSKAHLDAGRFQVVFGRWPLYLILLALEIVVVCGGSIALGVPNTSIAWYVLVFVVTGFTFLCLMQFFNLFGIAGKALAILVLIFQICCCSGTFPAFLGADYASAIGQFLPFTYAIDAFREVLSGGNFATAGRDLLTLLVFSALGIALTLLCYPLGLKMKKKSDAATLVALTGTEEAA